MLDMNNPIKGIRTLDELHKASREYRFINSFYDLQNDAAEINKISGFVDQDSLMDEFEGWFKYISGCDELDIPGAFKKFSPLFDQFRGARKGLKLALTVGEISEALEAVRKNKGADDHIPEFTAEEAELADVVIRLMNYAHDGKLRVAEAIVAKNEYNRHRHDHKKENRAQVGGKKF